MPALTLCPKLGTMVVSGARILKSDALIVSWWYGGNAGWVEPMRLDPFV